MSANFLTIDFETRSKLTVGEVGAYTYAGDASTSVMCMAYRLPGQITKIWEPTLPFPQEVIEHVGSKGPVEAHNAGFEYAVWNYCLIRLLPEIPRLELTQLYCSAAMAAALSLPRKLEKLAIVLNTSVQKDMAGNRVMLKLSQPRKATLRDNSEWHTDPIDYETLYSYCINDVDTEAEVSSKLKPLTPDERKVWLMTERINERGIYCNLPLVKTAISFADRYQSEVLEKFEELTGGKVKTVKQVAKFRAYLGTEYGVDMPDMSAATVDATLARTDIPEGARELLTIRRALAKSSITKYQSMENVAGPGRRLRGTLRYHGAGTGRYSGKLIQPQNYPKATIKDVDNIHAALEFGDYDFFKCLYPDVFSALSSGLRGMLCAPPGKELFAGDFSAIEARVLLWLAQDELNIKPWRDKKDVYVLMASRIYNIPASEVLPFPHRDIGKRTILGAGFGMGPPRFKDMCLELGGVEISLEFAAKVIATYREMHPRVVSFWKELERACISAVRYKGKTYKSGRLYVQASGGFLWVKLPSGRKIAYNAPEVRLENTKFGPKAALRFMAENPVTRKWERESTYGGKLVENAVQAVARDVMVDSMTRVQRCGYKVVMSIHDEVISERRKGEGSLDEFISLMSEVPQWAEGLPLAVSGWTGDKYKK